MIIFIKKDCTEDSLRTELANLREGVANDDCGPLVTIKLPANLKYGGAVGAESALIQFLITVRSLRGPFDIAPSYTPNDITDFLLPLSKQAYGIAAFYLCRKLLDQNFCIERKELMSYVIPYIDAVTVGDYADSNRGLGASLIMISGAKNEYIAPLFVNRTPNLKPRSEIIREITKILKPLVPRVKRAGEQGDVFATVGLGVRELVENVEDHAMTDLAGVEISPNIRMVLFRKHHVNPNQLSTLGSGAESLKEFAGVSAIKAAANKSKALSIIEITVIDSGVGMAARWLGKNLAKNGSDEQIVALKTCFERGKSTKRGVSNVGEGLHRLTKVAHANDGVVEVRSGNAVVWYRFLHSRALEGEVPWRSYSLEDPGLRGTRVSILIPMTPE